MVCTETLLGGMRLAAWQNSRSTKVRPDLGLHMLLISHHNLTDMLTPIDQPLDKLQDLTQDEVYVAVSLLLSIKLIIQCLSAVRTCAVCYCSPFLIYIPNMSIDLGWYEHFSNKYVVCGKLVNDDAA
jgi:hypothetical protein